MKLKVSKKQLGLTPEMWLRRAGYTFLPAGHGGQDSFARRLGRDFYPRFHIYFTLEKAVDGEEMVIFNLHLDQKRPGYVGQRRHNAEYEGDVVENELLRLKNLIMPDIFL